MKKGAGPQPRRSVLSLAARQLPAHWYSRYAAEPLLLETLVDQSRCRGTCSRAANWIGLGVTAGRGRMDREHRRHDACSKTVLVLPLVKDVRRMLRGSCDMAPPAAELCEDRFGMATDDLESTTASLRSAEAAATVQGADGVDRERLPRTLRGGASLVAAGMRRSATQREPEPDRRENVGRCAACLLNHTAYLRYHEYLAAGFPIATGVIEGACRHPASDPRDQSGGCWPLAGAGAMLRLRAPAATSRSTGASTRSASTSATTPHATPTATSSRSKTAT